MRDAEQGPHILDAVATLADILDRTTGHHDKKNSLLRSAPAGPGRVDQRASRESSTPSRAAARRDEQQRHLPGDGENATSTWVEDSSAATRVVSHLRDTMSRIAIAALRARQRRRMKRRRGDRQPARRFPPQIERHRINGLGIGIGIGIGIG